MPTVSFNSRATGKRTLMDVKSTTRNKYTPHIGAKQQAKWNGSYYNKS